MGADRSRRYRMGRKMKHTYNIKMRATLWAALGAVSFAVPVMAIDVPVGVCVDPRGCGVTSSPSPTPSGPSPEEVKHQKERARLKAKEWSSDEALDYFDRKDLGQRHPLLRGGAGSRPRRS